MLEREIERRVCAAARAGGWLVYKFTAPSARAVPDRMFLRDGVVFFVEFKARGQKATPAQLHEHSKIRRAGIGVYVIDSVDTGIALLASC